MKPRHKYNAKPALGQPVIWAPDVPHLATRADMVEAYGEGFVEEWEGFLRFQGRRIPWERK
jgi:hypothetical protein